MRMDVQTLDVPVTSESMETDVQAINVQRQAKGLHVLGVPCRAHRCASVNRKRVESRPASVWNAEHPRTKGTTASVLLQFTGPFASHQGEGRVTP